MHCIYKIKNITCSFENRLLGKMQLALYIFNGWNTRKRTLHASDELVKELLQRLDQLVEELLQFLEQLVEELLSYLQQCFLPLLHSFSLEHVHCGIEELLKKLTSFLTLLVFKRLNWNCKNMLTTSGYILTGSTLTDVICRSS